MERHERCGRMAAGGEFCGSAGRRGRGLTDGRPAMACSRRGLIWRVHTSTESRGPVGRQRGLTALELMVALGIVALLTSIAVPGFAAFRRSIGLSSAANELIGALHMARSSAVLRGLPVAVCLTRDDETCLAAPGLAAGGWLVYLPEGQASATRAAPVGTVLHHFRLPVGLEVSGTRPAVTFWPVTRASSTSTFDLCDVRNQGEGRSIVVSQTGRPRVAAEVAPCAG